MRYGLLILAFAGFVAATAGGLFVLNGKILAWREQPLLGHSGLEQRPLETSPLGVEIRIVAYNIAKAFAYKQRLEFEPRHEVEARIEDIAEVLRAVDPDLVFVSEILHECPPLGFSQVRRLALLSGSGTWLFGECYNIGLPYYRVSGGNAILSRLSIQPERNISLAGRKPFYVSSNNRRALFGVARIGRADILLGSLHNDSRGGKNNLAQMRQILDHVGTRPAILAGDFNARPRSPSMDLVRASGRFTRIIEDQLTHPARRPDRVIDYVLVPADWEVLEYRVLPSTVSDHRPVFARFRCPPATCGADSTPAPRSGSATNPNLGASKKAVGEDGPLKLAN